MSTMVRSGVLFVALVLVSLTAGRAFWAWLGEAPANMGDALYVAFFQALDRQIATPIAFIATGGVLLTGLAAALHFTDARAFWPLLFACAAGLAATVVTVFAQLPINAQIATWNPAELPTNAEELLELWRRWHAVRFLSLSAGAMALYAAVLARRA